MIRILVLFMVCASLAHADPSPWYCKINSVGTRECWRTVPAGDGCNTCTQSDQGAEMCTLLACGFNKSSVVDPACQPKAGETKLCSEK